MAYGRFRRTTRRKPMRGIYRRRSYRKRYFKRPYISRRMPLEYPGGMSVKLRNVESIDLDLSTQIEKGVAIRINSPYDPYYSVGGGSPSGYDHWASMYSKYLCYGSSHKISFTVYSSNNTKMVCGSAVLNSSDTLPVAGTYGQWLTECKGSICKTMASRAVDAPPLPKFISKRYCSVKRIEGLRHLTVNDLSYCAPTTTNPALSPLLYVAAGTADGSSATAVIKCEIISTYYVKFFAPRAANTAA